MSKRNLFYIAYAVVLLSAFAWTLFRTFTNIDMTRTRLFVSYWPEWVIIIVTLLVMEWLRGTKFRRPRWRR